MARLQVEVAQSRQIGHRTARTHGRRRTRGDGDIRRSDTLAAGRRILEDVQDGCGFIVAEIGPGNTSVLRNRPESTTQTDALQQRGSVGEQKNEAE